MTQPVEMPSQVKSSLGAGDDTATDVMSVENLEASAGALEQPQENADKTSSSKEKKKREIHTLEDFIRYAYERKGGTLALSPSVEKKLAGDARLSDTVMDDLLRLADADPGLTVARQLLLLAPELSTYPGLAGAMRGFVRNVLNRHPVANLPGIAAALNNLDEAPSAADALQSVMNASKASFGTEVEVMKDAEFFKLRANVVYFLAGWIADSRGLAITALADLLVSALWGGAAKKLTTQRKRFQALTEIEDIEAVGLVADAFRQQAIERAKQADRACAEAEVLRTQVSTLNALLNEANTEIEHVQTQLNEVKVGAEQSISAMQREIALKEAHLRDDKELMRTRLLRRLSDDVAFLEGGLDALRHPQPKIHVMEDRAQRVADALREEIRKLEEE